MAEHRIIHATPLRAAIAAIVRAGGSLDAEAETVAANLVEANLRGHDSHGVGMIPRYIAALGEKLLNPNMHVGIVRDAGTLLTLDGNHGYGQVIGVEAMALGIERAQKHGVCLVGLASAHHLGRIGHWAEQCAAENLVSIHFVNVISRPIVAPFGGRDARIGTNPFCVGVPRAGKDPIILDLATSKIAQGKTRVAYNKGVPLEPNTIIDNNGDPTTDPRFTVVEPSGALLPFGEHKGSGIALVCELLGGALSGGDTGHDLPRGLKRVYNSMFSIIVDPQAMGTAENLTREVEAFVQWFTASPPAAGVDRVRIAGDPEREWKALRLKEGIPVDDATWREILRAGEAVGLSPSQVERIVA